MKKLGLIGMLAMLAACGGNGASVENDKAVAEELRKTVEPNLEGVWVMSDFITKMDSARSPKIASDLLEGVVGININKASVRPDSMEGGVNWNNHEGSGFSIYFKKGAAENSLKSALKDDKGIYEIGYKDKSLVLYHYDAANKLIDERLFSKVLRKQLNSDLSFGIQYIVNKKLMEGKYAVTDSAKGKSQLELSVDGKVTGMADYKYYLVATDFMDAFSNMDYITFLKNENAGDAFGYVCKKDTIQLYTILKNDKEGSISYGKLRYTLVKQP